MQEMSEHGSGPTDGSSERRRGASSPTPRRARRAQSSPRPDSRRMPSWTNGAELAAIQRANGSVNPCFGCRDDRRPAADARACRRAGACRSSDPGWSASSRPDALDELVIDKRHADFEAVGHRHDVEVAQQLRAQIQAAFEPRDGGRRPLRARRVKAARVRPAAPRRPRPRHTSRVAQRRTGERRDFVGQKESALHAIRFDQAAVGRRRSGAIAPAGASGMKTPASDPTAGQSGPASCLAASARGSRVNDG